MSRPIATADSIRSCDFTQSILSSRLESTERRPFLGKEGSALLRVRVFLSFQGRVWTP